MASATIDHTDGQGRIDTPTRRIDTPTRRIDTPTWLIAGYALAMPFLAGLPRGLLFPVVRPSEALQAAVTLAALVVAGSAVLAGRRWRVQMRPVEWWLVATAVGSSVLPLLWLAARGQPVGGAQLLAALPFVKYAALYVLVRGAMRSTGDVVDVARALVGSAVVIALVAMAQALRVGPVVDVLGRFFVSSADELVDEGRGTTTIGSSIATGAYLTLSGGLALSIGLTPRHRRWLLPAAVCLLGAVASGQAGTVVGLAIVVVTVARRHRRLTQLVAWGLPLSAVGLLGLWSVLAARLDDLDQGTGLPISWLVRWNNLSELYLPSLRDGGWLLGVSPEAVLRPPDVWRATVYLESGYLWLLWVGGLPLLVAAIGFLVSANRSLAVGGRRTPPPDMAGAVRVAAAAGVLAMAVLSLIDPHLTLRAGADVFFVLLAMAGVDHPLFVESPPPAERWRRLLAGPRAEPGTGSGIRSGTGIESGTGCGAVVEPATRLQLSEIPPARHRAHDRPEIRLALTAVRRGRRVAAAELALHRTGPDLRGVLGPIDAAAAGDRALLWRAAVLCADSLRLIELRIDGAEPDLDGTAPADRRELVLAAGLARRLERDRATGAEPSRPRALREPREAREAQPGGTVVRPPIRLEIGPAVPAGKRLVDLLVGAAVLAATTPLWLAAALLVRRSGPGPIIFRQVRIGSGGLPFQIEKFRTMAVDNDDSAHRAQNRRELLDAVEATKEGDDPRISPVGRWLRRMSLDELPQLRNVVRGEMSLVGPRPSLVWETELFEPRFRRRLVARPGLTGLWQTSGRADVSMTGMLQLDLDYVDRMGPGVDLRCLAGTASSVLTGDGAR